MKHRAEDTEAEGKHWVDQRGAEGYRAGDDPMDGERYLRVRRRERFRTIVLSVLCSGFVALAIVYVVELGSRNNAVEACNLEMQSRALIAAQQDESADGVLGDPNNKDAQGRPDPIEPFNFEGTSLESFSPLIIANARTSRRRSIQFARSVRDCEKLFPRPKFFGIIG